MSQLPLVLRRAEAADFAAIGTLLTGASHWLSAKGTDQWAAPWPATKGRDEDIKRAIGAGRTWIVLDRDSRPAATLTAGPNHDGIWPEERGREQAVYVRRLVVSRPYAGHGLGSQLLDWAGRHAAREYGARWVRVDAWTTNTRLHAYYNSLGFQLCGLSAIPSYPSAALFQKPVDRIRPAEDPLFRQDPGTATASG